MDTDDAESFGRPNSATAQENLKKRRKITLKDRKLKLRGLANTVKTSEGCVFMILPERLSIKKHYLQYVLGLLTFDDSKRCCSCLGKQSIRDLFMQYVTMDGTQIHHQSQLMEQ